MFFRNLQQKGKFPATCTGLLVCMLSSILRNVAIYIGRNISSRGLYRECVAKL